MSTPDSESARSRRSPTAEELMRTPTSERPHDPPPSASALPGESAMTGDQSSIYPGLAAKPASRSSVYPGCPDGHVNESSIYTGTGGSSVDAEKVGSGYAHRAPLGDRIDKPATASGQGDGSQLSKANVRGLVVLLGVMLLILVAAGVCSRSGEKTQKTVVYGKKVFPGLRFIGVEATRKENNPELIEEILAVLESNGMPADLFGTPLDYRGDHPERERTISAQLRNLFEPLGQNPEDLQKLRDTAPLGDWAIPPATLREVAPLLVKFQTPRLLIRRMLADEEAVFGIEPYEADVAPTPDPRVADWLTDYVMLEEYAVAQALANNVMPEAVEAVSGILRIADLASHSRSMSTRFATAAVRQKALNILQALVGDPRCTPDNRELFREKLQRTCDSWPSDAVAWEAERAYGMQVFEIVRQKGLLPNLPRSSKEIDRSVRRRERPKQQTEEEYDAEIVERAKLSIFAIDELETLDRRGILESVNNNLYHTIDGDETFYLRTMRSLIDSCRVPFYERKPAFAALEEELKMRFGEENEPYIAELLLRGAHGTMETLAVDRAQTEAFRMALELASAKDTDAGARAEAAINPLDGKPYTIRATEEHVVVGFHPNIPPYVVPKDR